MIKLAINNLLKYFKQNDILLIFIIGIFIRLIVAFLYTHNFDFLNILVLSKSVADTNNLTAGYNVLINKTGEIQLYGKFFYQVTAIWLKILHILKIININYLLDTKPYQNLFGYLAGFLQWGPFHYQIFSIKLIQFLYDFTLLFLLLIIAKKINLLNDKNKRLIFLFWALNPFIIITGYVLFQSDLLLTATLLTSLYFLLKFNQEKNYRFFCYFLFFISLGASIKQVSILLLPIFLILYVKNLLSLLLTLLIFSVFYLITSQSFASDFNLIKSFFINSNESLQLFNFSFNNASVFFLLYFFFLYTIYLEKKKIKKNNSLIVVVYVLILIIVYLTYNTKYLFIQFNLWIVPFIFLLTLVNKNFTFLFIPPTIGLFKRLFEDGNSLIGAMTVSAGSPLQYYLPYDFFIERFINPQVVSYYIYSFFIFAYIYSFYFLFNLIKNKNNKNLIKIKIPIEKIIILIFIFFFFFYFFDFLFRKQMVLLTRYQLQNPKDELLNKNILFKINNPNQFKITAFDIKIKTKKINDLNPLKIYLFNQSQKQIALINLSPFDLLNRNKDIFTITLPKSLNNKEIIGIITNENSKNEYSITTGNLVIKPEENSAFAGYDNFYKNKKISVNFKKPIYLNIRGNYSLSEVFNNFKIIFSQKPKFYLILLSSLSIILLKLLILILKKNVI